MNFTVSALGRPFRHRGSMWGMTEEDCTRPDYQRYLEGVETRGLSADDYQRSCFFGVVKRWQKAPRNRRGPAADASGLTHQKMM